MRITDSMARIGPTPETLPGLVATDWVAQPNQLVWTKRWVIFDAPNPGTSENEWIIRFRHVCAWKSITHQEMMQLQEDPWRSDEVRYQNDAVCGLRHALAGEITPNTVWFNDRDLLPSD